MHQKLHSRPSRALERQAVPSLKLYKNVGGEDTWGHWSFRCLTFILVRLSLHASWSSLPSGMSFFHLFCRPTLHSGVYAASKTWKCCFFNVKLMIFIHRWVRLARYGAVSEGLAGPYWPSKTTSKPPLDLQKIVRNLIIFAQQAPRGPSCRSKGTHKCLDIRFKQKTQNCHPCLSKTHIFG